MGILDIICFISTAELLYFMYQTIRWNFYHGNALRNMKNISVIVRMSIFTTVIIFVSIKTKIISVTMIFLFLYYLLKYIENKNQKVYQNNDKLFHFYTSEIKRFQKQCYIFLCFCYFMIIIDFYVKNAQ